MTESPNNTVITTAGPTITDASGNVWAMTTPPGQVVSNGSIVARTTAVDKIAYVNHVFWQHAATGWYSNAVSGGTVVDTGGPTQVDPTAPGGGLVPWGTWIGFDPAANATGLNTEWDNLSQLFGRSPTIWTTFMDNRYPADPALANSGYGWPQQAAYCVNGMAGNSRLKNCIPHLGWTMGSNGNQGGSFGNFFSKINDGSYDTLIGQVLDNIKSAGFLTFYTRLGWEANLSGYGYNWVGTDGSAYVTAFQNLSSKIKAGCASRGMTVQIIWCPNIATLNGPTVTQCYPGDAYVDVLGVDEYGNGVDDGWTGYAPDATTTDSHQYYLQTMIAMSAGTANLSSPGNNWTIGNGKPICLGESGSNDTAFATSMVTALKNRPSSVQMLFFGMWEDGDGINSYVDTSGASPALTAVGKIWAGGLGSSGSIVNSGGVGNAGIGVGSAFGTSAASGVGRSSNSTAVGRIGGIATVRGLSLIVGGATSVGSARGTSAAVGVGLSANAVGVGSSAGKSTITGVSMGAVSSALAPLAINVNIDPAGDPTGFNAEWDAMVTEFGRNPEIYATYYDPAYPADPTIIDPTTGNQNGYGWPQQANYCASAMAGNTRTAGCVPFIAWPMGTYGGHGGSNGNYFAAITGNAAVANPAGPTQTYNSLIDLALDAWKTAGFTKLYIRPCIQMNQGFPWTMVGSVSAFIAAWQALVTELRSYAATIGVSVYIFWEPLVNSLNGPTVNQAYPGDPYVDVLSIDEFGTGIDANWASYGPLSTTTDTTLYYLQTMIDMATGANGQVNGLGKGISVGQTGSNDTAFANAMVSALTNRPAGVVLSLVGLVDAGQGINSYSGTAVGTAWAAGLGSGGTVVNSTVAASTASAVGSASGLARAAAVGRANAVAVGSAAGIGVASGLGIAVTGAVGTASGSSSVVGIAPGISPGVGTASGIGVASGVGVRQFVSPAKGTAAGVGVASGYASPFLARVGQPFVVFLDG